MQNDNILNIKLRGVVKVLQAKYFPLKTTEIWMTTKILPPLKV
jgi:hypothetical protein